MTPSVPSLPGARMVLILEDDPPTAGELRALLDGSGEFGCVGVFSRVREAVEATRRLMPDAVLADMQIEGELRPDAIREFKQAAPRTTVLTLTAYEEPDLLFQALQAGADGYLLKTDTTLPLLQALKLALEEVPPFSPRVARQMLRYFRERPEDRSESGLSLLTARQKQVLELLHQGYSNREIAEKLGVGTDAVKMHVREVLRKLQIESRVEAAAIFERHAGRR